MPDILHYLEIEAPAAKVFEAITTPAGLNSWWTNKAQGEAILGTSYQFWFSSEYDWRAVVMEVTTDESIQWKLTEADEDWTGTTLGFNLKEEGNRTEVDFYNKNWKTANLHFRRSNYCWAMYLQTLKKNLE